MSWLLLSLIGYAILAVVFVLDKLILTKSFDRPVVYTFYSTIFMFGALLAWPFGVELLVGIDWLWAIISGVGFGLGLWAMFIAVQKGEASHVNPFIGASITIVTFVLASFFLGEHLTVLQIVGMSVLFVATLLLAVFNEKGYVGFDKSYWWGVGAAIMFAISHTTAKYLYDLYPFLTGFVWTRATTGIVGLITLCVPAVWQSFKRQPTAKKKRVQYASKYSRAKSIIVVISAKGLGVAGVVLIQLAIAIGSVTLVNALVGVQYAFMYAIIYVCSRFFPRVFKERFSKKEVLVEGAAIFLVIVGSAMFVL